MTTALETCSYCSNHNVQKVNEGKEQVCLDVSLSFHPRLVYRTEVDPPYICAICQKLAYNWQEFSSDSEVVLPSLHNVV